MSESSFRFLVESAADLNSSLELDKVFRKVAERIKPLIDYHLFCVMLWSETTQLLEHSFSLCFGEHIPQAGGFPPGYGIGGTAAAERRPVRVPNVLSDPRYVRYRHPEVEIRSELAVPLLFQDRLIGVLDLESVNYDAFSEQNEQMLTALASHIAIAIENARLYQKVRNDERRLEEDLATARDIQHGLLPRTAPRLPGLEIGSTYVPARALGGDFYDFLPYGDDRLAVVVADVAGKATAAALYGSLAVGILRGQVVEHRRDPVSMLEHMNEHLHRTGIENRFVAMVFGLYDRTRRTLELANAGFPRPLAVLGGQAREIRIEGIPLGLFAGRTYDATTLRLGPGDVVALCSDGFQECTNGRGEPFGTTRLMEVLTESVDRSAQGIADLLARATAEHSGGEDEQDDDRTAVVLKVVPGSI